MNSSAVPWFADIVHIHSYKIAFRISLTYSVFDKKMPHLLREGEPLCVEGSNDFSPSEQTERYERFWRSRWNSEWSPYKTL